LLFLTSHTAIKSEKFNKKGFSNSGQYSRLGKFEKQCFYIGFLVTVDGKRFSLSSDLFLSCVLSSKRYRPFPGTSETNR